MPLVAVAWRNATSVAVHAGRCRRVPLVARKGQRPPDEIEPTAEQAVRGCPGGVPASLEARTNRCLCGQPD